MMKKRMLCTFVVVGITIMAGTVNVMAASTDGVHTRRKRTTLSADAAATRIGKVAAKEIALKHAGLTESAVTFTESKLDYDDGRTVYEIEFYAGDTAYAYEIDAYTGDVRSHEYDVKRNTSASTPISSANRPSARTQSARSASTREAHIGEAAAKEIALKHTGLTESTVTYTEVSFEYDDGIGVYQIEFVSGLIEYEFEINAVTGTIMEYEAESVYD